MSSMKSFFIAISLVICLHIISSLASTISHPIPYPWILTKIAGKRFKPGQKVTLKIRSPSKTTVGIDIQQGQDISSQVLVKNFKLKAGDNEVKVKLPSSGNFAKPSPEYFFVITKNRLRVSISATFEIGNPVYGVTIFNPVAGDVLKAGDKIKLRWKGRFDLPGAAPSKYHSCAFGNSNMGGIYFTRNNFNLTIGSIYYRIPLNTIPDLYQFWCFIDTDYSHTKEYMYYSGTFQVIPKH
ncbi:hypothetical protein Glove_165g168 [Diversispora epigaea]|uniref:Uncharacterized protein n=1 Tax=Diversispora epigaea TaxID=1348612 RepID=A0A397IR66_9GLOM|nr:hypothetical protein Glove_165g168 [Diversispora epigaea]